MPIAHPAPVHRTGDRTPVHRALDALTAAMLDAQRLDRALSEGSRVGREQRTAIRRINDELRELRESLGALHQPE